MPALNTKAYNQAVNRLERAKHHLTVMSLSSKSIEIENAWSQFLSEHHTAFTKLEKAMNKGPAKGYCDRIKEIRRKDQLLCYIHHTRNADNHGIEEIVEHETLKLFQNFETGEMEFEHSWTFYGELSRIMPRAEKSKLKLLRQTARIRLVPVIDRGKVYAPPNSHLGNKIFENNAIIIAKLAIDYLESTLKEVGKQFLVG